MHEPLMIGDVRKKRREQLKQGNVRDQKEEKRTRGRGSKRERSETTGYVFGETRMDKVDLLSLHGGRKRGGNLSKKGFTPNLGKT